MIKLEDKTLYITRGDSTNEHNKLVFNWNDYEYQESDIITLIIFEKKGYPKNEVLKKEYNASDLIYDSTNHSIELELTTDDTLKFPLKNKKQTFWFDIYLNDNTTMLGFDEDGAKKCIVYPGIER